jgi:hypothetical protein
VKAPGAQGELPTTTARARIKRYQPAGDGSAREIVLLSAAHGSRLVIDRSIQDRSDARLLAHLAADEPDANAHHVAREYLAGERHRCRAPHAYDLFALPDGATPAPIVPPMPARGCLVAANGARYRLSAVGNPPELRWQSEALETGSIARTVSAREVVAALEEYEPVLELSRAAVSALRRRREVSIATLSLELRRLEASPIVLNRRLREAVLDAVRERGVSLSAIAIACGRMKRDPRGNGSGETSWLARRIGLVTETGAGVRNPWVHSDTLALIARDGLGIAPREVELG